MKLHLKQKASIMLVCVLVVTLISGGVFALQDNTQKVVTSEWTYIGDEYYSLVKTGGKTSLLVKRLQDSDFEDIIMQLIDISVEPDYESAKIAAEDPDAALPDNMLPDGRTLVENWEEKYSNLLRSASEMKILEVAEGVSPHMEDAVISPQRSAPVGKVTDSFAVAGVTVEQNTLVLPTNFDFNSSTFNVAPSGRGVLYSTDEKMVFVDSTGSAKTVSPLTYAGKSYEDLSKESINLYGENLVFWNGQVKISPNSERVAYVSNKADISQPWALFVSDLETGKEKKLSEDSSMHYFVENWLDESHILCMKTYDDTYQYSIVSTDGKEHSLDFEAKNPVILGVHNGVVAYGNSDNDVIYFARIEDSGAMKTIGKFKLDGTFRIRPGIDPFNSDGSKFAYILVPSDNYYGRDIVVVDLKTMTESTNRTVPLATKKAAAVLEFDWLNDEILLTAVIVNETQRISTWIYQS